MELIGKIFINLVLVLHQETAFPYKHHLDKVVKKKTGFYNTVRSTYFIFFLAKTFQP